jgi:hypothetical protein
LWLSRSLIQKQRGQKLGSATSPRCLAEMVMSPLMGGKGRYAAGESPDGAARRLTPRPPGMKLHAR